MSQRVAERVVSSGTTPAVATSSPSDPARLDPGSGAAPAAAALASAAGSAAAAVGGDSGAGGGSGGGGGGGWSGAMATAATAARSMSPETTAVLGLIAMNIFSSVTIVSCNKLLVQTFGFTFVILLSACHFLATWAFMHVASSARVGMFKRATAPLPVVLRISVAGLGSILLMNLSLRFNSIGSYQILKVAVLPCAIFLSYVQRISTPSVQEVMAAACVVIGTCVCTVTDVTTTTFGFLLGSAAVVATAQYQIFQGSIQQQHSLSSTQALHLMSLPQALLSFLASLLFETSWARYLPSAADGGATATLRGGALRGGVEQPGDGGGDEVEGGSARMLRAATAAAGALVERVSWAVSGAASADPRVLAADGAVPARASIVPAADDIWQHSYTGGEVMLIFITCLLAVLLNYSTIALIGKTSAVSMQFVNQSKTVLIVAVGFVLFPQVTSFTRIASLLIGLAIVFAGVAWYTRLKQMAPKG